MLDFRFVSSLAFGSQRNGRAKRTFESLDILLKVLNLHSGGGTLLSKDWISGQ